MDNHNYAILIVDMLNDFFAKGVLKKLRPELVRNINRLVGESRRQGHPIIWIRQEVAPDLSDAPLLVRKKKIHTIIAGTPGCQLLPELDHQPTDHEIIKKRQSAFFRTELDSLLSQLGSTHLVLGGIATHACIRVTAIDAYQRDYEVLIPSECVASPDREHHEISLRFLDEGLIAQVQPLDTILEELITSGPQQKAST